MEFSRQFESLGAPRAPFSIRAPWRTRVVSTKARHCAGINGKQRLTPDAQDYRLLAPISFEMPNPVTNRSSSGTWPKEDPAIKNFDEILERKSIRSTHISLMQLVLIANCDRSAIDTQLSRAASHSPYEFWMVRTLHKSRSRKQAAQLAYMSEIVTMSEVE